MSDRKLRSGRWFAELKSGRAYVGGKAFGTKREAQAWLDRKRAALVGGVDPRAGRATVRTLLPVWLEERRHSVAAKTYVADAALPRLVPNALAVPGHEVGDSRWAGVRPPSAVWVRSVL